MAVRFDSAQTRTQQPRTVHNQTTAIQTRRIKHLYVYLPRASLCSPTPPRIRCQLKQPALTLDPGTCCDSVLLTNQICRCPSDCRGSGCPSRTGFLKYSPRPACQCRPTTNWPLQPLAFRFDETNVKCHAAGSRRGSGTRRLRNEGYRGASRRTPTKCSFECKLEQPAMLVQQYLSLHFDPPNDCTNVSSHAAHSRPAIVAPAE